MTPSQKNWHDNYAALKTDTLYAKITARMCLNHKTGFANWRWDEPDQQLRVHAIPGSRYRSGEGLVYLQVVVEQYLNKPLEQLMREYVFDPLHMKNSSYTWQPEFEKDYCVGHKSNGESYEKDKDNDARSASTLETTFEDMIPFTTAILSNDLLKISNEKEMSTQQIKIRSVAQYGPMSLKDSDANDKINLGYGLGLGLLTTPYGFGAFKEGPGDGFRHYSIIFPQTGIGILILNNRDNAQSIFKELLESAIADVYTPWKWEHYIPYDQKEN